jgi:hypothetical protein
MRGKIKIFVIGIHIYFLNFVKNLINSVEWIILKNMEMNR